MRKILVGVLSVAGLCAVVLALAASPASATKDVVTITSGADAGTYTVSWETLGNCDPGSGTSGGTGSATITVADDGSGTGTGTPVETGVVIDDICEYVYSASLIKTDGSTCAATLAVAASAGTVVVTTCNTVADVTVTVAAHDPDTNLSGTPETDPSALDIGAVGETAFTVTATPTAIAGADPDDECNAVSGDTTVDAASVNSVTLTVVDGTLNGGTCLYDIAVALPAGFAAGAAGTTVAEDVDPASGTGDDQSLTVSVASRTVYLVQNVVGDAGGVSVVYQQSSACGAPGLPGALSPRAASGGIVTVAGSTITELRRGRFNVSEAIASVDGWSVAALNDEAEGCEATVTVSGLPDGCSSSASQTTDLEDSDDTVMIEFSVDCTPPAEEPPMEEPPMEEPPMEEPPMEEPVGPKQDTPTG